MPSSWMTGRTRKHKATQLEADEEYALQLAVEFQDEKKRIQQQERESQALYQGTPQMSYNPQAAPVVTKQSEDRLPNPHDRA